MLKLWWGPHRRTIFSGDAVGYTGSSVAMMDALARVPGVVLVDSIEESDVAIHYCHAWNFQPVAGRPNILFTMYELDPVPDEFGAAARDADAVFTPSRFSAELLRRCSVPHGKPLEVVPLGFDPEVWPERIEPRTFSLPFTFLYVGALNDRKGTQVIIRAWERFRDTPGVRLIMKVSGVDGARRVIERDNVIFDERALPIDELRRLYDAAHVFLFPTLGEGFGLTPLEAAAQALPLIVSAGGAIGEFLDPALVASALPTKRHALRDANTGLTQYGQKVDVDAVPRAMLDVMRNYAPHARNARRLARRIRAGWTYDAAARACVAAVERLGRERRWLRAA